MKKPCSSHYISHLTYFFRAFFKLHTIKRSDGGCLYVSHMHPNRQPHSHLRTIWSIVHLTCMSLEKTGEAETCTQYANSTQNGIQAKPLAVRTLLRSDSYILPTVSCEHA